MATISLSFLLEYLERRDSPVYVNAQLAKLMLDIPDKDLLENNYLNCTLD